MAKPIPSMSITRSATKRLTRKQASAPGCRQPAIALLLILLAIPGTGPLVAQEVDARAARCQMSSNALEKAIDKSRAAIDDLATDRDAINAFYWQWYQRISRQDLDCKAFDREFGPIDRRLQQMDDTPWRESLQQAYICVVMTRAKLANMAPNRAIAAQMSELSRRKQTIDRMLAELDVIENKRARLRQGFQEVFIDACNLFR
jgi:prefoldin subunit 5